MYQINNPCTGHSTDPLKEVGPTRRIMQRRRNVRVGSGPFARCGEAVAEGASGAFLSFMLHAAEC